MNLSTVGTVAKRLLAQKLIRLRQEKPLAFYTYLMSCRFFSWNVQPFRDILEEKMLIHTQGTSLTIPAETRMQVREIFYGEENALNIGLSTCENRQVVYLRPMGRPDDSQPITLELLKDTRTFLARIYTRHRRTLHRLFMLCTKRRSEIGESDYDEVLLKYGYLIGDDWRVHPLMKATVPRFVHGDMNSIFPRTAAPWVEYNVISSEKLKRNQRRTPTHATA